MTGFESEELYETAKLLREAVLKRDVGEALYLLKQATSAKNARAIADLAEQIPGPMLTTYAFCYSSAADGNKETVTVYRTGIHNSAVPVAAVTFED